MGDEMKMIEVGGVSGVDADSDSKYRWMFDADPLGTLGWLERPWQDAAATFRYDAATESWALLNRIVMFMDGGVGAGGAAIGFSGAQTEDATSLLLSGHATSAAYFTLRGISLRFSPLGYAPASSSQDVATNTPVVSRDGVLREDTVSLAQSFADVLFGSSMLEIFQLTRKCFVVLGRADTFRSDVPVQFKRVLMLPPGDSNTPEYVIRMKTARSLSVPRDKNFPAPEDGALAVFTLTLELEGYCSTSTGHPLVTKGDNAEALVCTRPMDGTEKTAAAIESVADAMQDAIEMFAKLGIPTSSASTPPTPWYESPSIRNIVFLLILVAALALSLHR